MEILNKIKQFHIWCLAEFTIKREEFLAGKNGEATQNDRAGGYRRESGLQTLISVAVGNYGTSVNSRVTSSCPGF